MKLFTLCLSLAPFALCRAGCIVRAVIDAWPITQSISRHICLRYHSTAYVCVGVRWAYFSPRPLPALSRGQFQIGYNNNNFVKNPFILSFQELIKNNKTNLRIIKQPIMRFFTAQFQLFAARNRICIEFLLLFFFTCSLGLHADDNSQTTEPTNIS